MQQSHVIDIDGAFVGAAVRLERGYRFIATDKRVDQLHGTHWPSLEELRRRAHRLYRAAGPDAGSLSGSSRQLSSLAAPATHPTGAGRLRRHTDKMGYRNEKSSSSISRRAILATPAVLSVTRKAVAEPAKVVRVGTQKGAGLLIAEQRQRGLENLLNPLGIEVKWTEFQFGPPLLEGMRAGAIDIGLVGDTPPIFSQAAHGDLLYIAAMSGSVEAILLPRGSTIQSLADLRGKRIAFGRGSSAHNVTVAAVEKAGLAWSDIVPVALGPADAAAAFERGAIDAWTIWDPYYALYQNGPGVRVLTESPPVVELFSFFLATRTFAESNPDLTAKILADFSRVDVWARANRPEIAQLIADGTGLPVEPVLRAVNRARFGVEPVTAALAIAQQRTADRFYRLGLIPEKINPADLVWRWPA